MHPCQLCPIRQPREDALAEDHSGGWASAFMSITFPRALTSFRVSNCSQSADPVGSIPIAEHLYSPNPNLFHKAQAGEGSATHTSN